MPRTPEQGHTKACLAAAMIRAIERARDDMWEDDVSFRIMLQDNRMLNRADAELDPENHRGGATCTCPPVASLCTENIDPDTLASLRRGDLERHPSEMNCRLDGDRTEHHCTHFPDGTVTDGQGNVVHNPVCDGLPLHQTTCSDRAAHM